MKIKGDQIRKNRELSLKYEQTKKKEEEEKEKKKNENSTRPSSETIDNNKTFNNNKNSSSVIKDEAKPAEVKNDNNYSISSTDAFKIQSLPDFDNFEAILGIDTIQLNSSK